ncbi:MAG: UDP-N-acetylglucosamine 1-carboxyvinyltransferase [Acidobacteriota bacterium]
MDRLRVTGGKPLEGMVEVSGAKNAALPALCACLLTAGEVRLRNVPEVRDVRTMLKVLERIGVDVEDCGGGEIRLRAERIATPIAPYELVKTMRASVLVLGPLLARTGRARVSLPGGCAIGARPVDFHVDGFKRMGARVDLEHGDIHAEVDKLQGGAYRFPRPSVTGTENLMMAGVLAEGTTVLENCAREPEVVDLADLLAGMGARIRGAGTGTIRIDGVAELGGADHRVVPDRIEAGTFLVAGALTGGTVTVRNCVPSHLESLIQQLEAVGVRLEGGGDWIRTRPGGTLKPADMSTGPYPEFPTDLQAQYMVLMTQLNGESMIRETIFENRFLHAAELGRMGAEIILEGNTARVRGPTPLKGARLMATDLRASASLVLAGLVADGVTVIDRIYHLDRGYARIEEKLRRLGGKVERMK